MRGVLGAVLVLTVGLAGGAVAGKAQAQTCSATAWPYNLANGSPADAGQVMNNFNCAGLYALGHATTAVGIGTTTPTQALDVVGNIKASNEIISTLGSSVAQLRIISGNYGVLLRNDGTNTYIMTTASGTPYGSWSSLRPFIMSDSTGDIYMSGLFTQQSTGFVGIGNNSPRTNLDVGGSIYSYGLVVTGSAGGTSAWAISSDARLKKDVVPISGALSLVERLRGVRYNWRSVAERTVGKDLLLPLAEPQIGFIAQEVAAVVPEAVDAPKGGAMDVYSLKETKLIPILVEAMKEQQAQITGLEVEIKQQQSQINVLKADLLARKVALK